MTIAGPAWTRQARTDEAPPGHRYSLYFDGWTEQFKPVDKGKEAVFARCCGLGPGHGQLLDQLIGRQLLLARGADAMIEDAVLTAPLATGLGLEHPLENGFAFAGPYGLPWVPGSSVKGVLRATAERLAINGSDGWNPALVWWFFGFDEHSAWHGSGQGRDRFKARLQDVSQEDLRALAALLPRNARKSLFEDPHTWILKCRPSALPPCRGALVVWDILPRVERLDVEVMTPHHSKYLQTDPPRAPLDCEDPVPIPFLALPSGTPFRLIVSLAPTGLLPAVLRETWRDLLRPVLRGAIESTGLGAKTAVGMGTGRIAGNHPHAAERTVELVTPGFLGGADQRSAKHTTLRAPALKGQLRWWWRTTQVGFLTTAELRALEDAIWGSVRTGKAPVRLRVAPAGAIDPMPAPFKRATGNAIGDNAEFYDQHHISEERRALGYIAYGMAEKRNNAILHRHVVPANSRFTVGVEVTGPGRFERKGLFGKLPALTEEEVSAQVALAWKLLCCFGAVGAKARKGFGSLDEVGVTRTPSEVLDQARTTAVALRQRLGLANRLYEVARADGAPSIGALAAAPIVVPFDTTDPWWIMNAVGIAMQTVAREWKHRERKVVLGLPRKIHGPRDIPLPGQQDHERPEPLRGADPVRNRHAAPAHVSVHKAPAGKLEVRMVAFVASKLPDEERSRTTLAEYVTRVESVLKELKPPSGGQAQAPEAVPLAAGGVHARGATPQQGSHTSVVLIGRTKKGGWKARLGRGDAAYEGPVLGTPPEDAKEGDVVDVVVQSVTTAGLSPRQAQFKWK